MKKSYSIIRAARTLAVLLLCCCLILFTGCDKVADLVQAVAGGEDATSSTGRQNDGKDNDAPADDSPARGADNPMAQWPSSVTPLQVSDFYLYDNGKVVYDPLEDGMCYYPSDFDSGEVGYVTSKGIGMDSTLEEIAQAYQGVPVAGLSINGTSIEVDEDSFEDLQTLMQNIVPDEKHLIVFVYRFYFADGEPIPSAIVENNDSETVFTDFLIESYMMTIGITDGAMDTISLSYFNYTAIQ